MKASRGRTPYARRCERRRQEVRASPDLRVERFYAGAPRSIMKTFPLRGIKDTPPYLHDGRCPTLEDSVGFNLVLGTNLTDDEKDLVAYLRGL